MYVYCVQWGSWMDGLDGYEVFGTLKEAEDYVAANPALDRSGYFIEIVTKHLNIR